MQVKAILVNIFGGIVDCTTIANGIVAACREIQMRMPLVVRLEGKYNNYSAGAVLIHLLLYSLCLQVLTVLRQGRSWTRVVSPYKQLVI